MVGLLKEKVFLLGKNYRLWKKMFESKRRYSTTQRGPFYDLASQYLPSDKDSIIVDIGAGDGGFARHLDLSKKHQNLFLLDGNPETVKRLKKDFQNAILYNAPDDLPFPEQYIHYIHCSHMIEHLSHQELYGFIKAVDRVLNKGGVFIISTPLLWDLFYEDLSHVKPYYPSIFQNYLCGKSNNRSASVISDKYEVLELAYRYSTTFGTDLNEGWGHALAPIDVIIQLLKVFLFMTGFKKYKKNGYTLILRKTR